MKPLKPAVFFVTETVRSASDKARTDALQEAVDQYLARALRRGESPAPPAGREDAGGAET